MNSNFNQPQPIQGRVETPQPIQKPPIPEEHVHMQTVFDELKQKCSYAANNPVSEISFIYIGRFIAHTILFDGEPEKPEKCSYKFIAYLTML